MSKLFAIAIAFVLTFSAVRCWQAYYPQDVLDSRTIVRLHHTDGSFFCSGTIISERYILTAAYCIAHQTAVQAVLGQISIEQDIEVREADGKLLGQVQVKAFLIGSDVAILEGRLEKHAFIPVETETNAIDSARQHHLISCGYPLAGRLTCTRVTHVTRYMFSWKAVGVLYQGMSGGPVIDLTTGKIVAINTAVLEEYIILSPTVELFSSLNL